MEWEQAVGQLIAGTIYGMKYRGEEMWSKEKEEEEFQEKYIFIITLFSLFFISPTSQYMV